MEPYYFEKEMMSLVNEEVSSVDTKIEFFNETLNY